MSKLTIILKHFTITRNYETIEIIEEIAHRDASQFQDLVSERRSFVAPTPSVGAGSQANIEKKEMEERKSYQVGVMNKCSENCHIRNTDLRTDKVISKRRLAP